MTFSIIQVNLATFMLQDTLTFATQILTPLYSLALSLNPRDTPTLNPTSTITSSRYIKTLTVNC